MEKPGLQCVTLWNRRVLNVAIPQSLGLVTRPRKSQSTLSVLIMFFKEHA